MKFNLNLTALSDAMGRYFQALHDKAISRVVPTVSTDNSDALNDLPYSDLETQSLQTIMDHQLVKGNPHNLTPADVGGYSEAEVRSLAATRMPEGILPLSSYGTPDYLPVGLAATFEGATTITEPKDAGMFVEDDGTLIILRNGTNGSGRGVYYAYLRNAMVGNLHQPIRTNKKYRPSFFPAGMEAAYVISCSESVIMGRLQDANGVLGDYFISLTNGTYNDAKHTGALISTTTYQGLRGTAILAGSTIYYMIPTGLYASGAFGYLVYQVSKAAVQAGGTVAFTLVTGITTTGFSGTVANAGLIHLANVSVSDDPATKPLVLSVGTGFTARNVFHYEIPYLQLAVDPVTGKLRGLVIGRSYFANSYSSNRGAVIFSFTYDPVRKTAALDETNIVQATMTRQDNNSITPSGTLFSKSEWALGYPPTGNVYDARIYSGSGWVFHMINSQTVDSVTLYRSQMVDFSDKYEALRLPRQSVVNYSGISLPPAFGSAVGGKLAAPIALSDTRMIFFSNGRSRNGETIAGLAYTDLEGLPTGYTHKSIYNGSYSGYKPSANRDFLTDIGVSNPIDLAAPIVEVNGSSHTVAGTRYLDGLKTTAPVHINADFTTSGSGSMSQAVIDDLKAKLAVALSAAGEAGVVQDMAVDVVFPQASGVPPFAVVMVLYTNRTIQEFVARLNVVGGVASGAVTEVSVHSLSPRVILSTGGLSLTRNQGYQLYAGATVIYTVGSVCLIGYAGPFGYLFVGNGPQTSIRFKYNKTTGQFVFGAGLGFEAYNALHSSRSYYASPSLGLGMIYGVVGSSGANDELTKLVFVPIAKTTESEFDNWSIGSVAKSSYRVLTSQEVAQGWVLYFTEETSVVLNGRFYKLPPQNFNLLTLTATPANRTFYVHVQVVNGEAKYLVSLTKQADSATLLYLGRVVTGANTITSIDVRKASRLENIQLVAAG